MAEKFLNSTGLAHLIDKIKARFTTNEGRIEAVETAQSTGDTKVDGLETNVQELTTNVTQAQADISRLDNEQDSQDARIQALEDADQNFLMKSGGQMSGDIDMNENAVTNVKDPSQNGDAANKRYVDSVVSGAVPPGKYLSTDGGTMSGDIDMGNHKVTNVATPVEGTDAANVDYVNAAVGVLSTNVTQAQQAAEAASAKADTVEGKLGDYLPVDNPTYTGILKGDYLMEDKGVLELKSSYLSEQETTVMMDVYKNEPDGPTYLNFSGGAGPVLTGLGDPVDYSDAVNKQYFDDNALTKNGGTLQGTLNANNMGKITGLRAPTADGDAANKQYVDDNFLSLKTGGTVNGNITMAPAARITGVITPEGDSDAANKQYVDSKLPSILWSSAHAEIHELVSGVETRLPGFTQNVIIGFAQFQASAPNQLSWAYPRNLISDVYFGFQKGVAYNDTIGYVKFNKTEKGELILNTTGTYSHVLVIMYVFPLNDIN